MNRESCLTTGADGETRTLTTFATAPSRRRVYQFHHVGINSGETPGEGGYTHQTFRALASRLSSFAYFGMSFVFESASAAGLSGVGTGIGAPGTVGGADDAGGDAITPFESLLCE